MKNRNLKKITCIGTGHMGQQIALQCALNGFNVSLFSRKTTSLEKAKSSIQKFCLRLIQLNIIKQDQVADVVAKIEFTNDLNAAVVNTDVLIECVVEDLEVRRTLFRKLEEVCPKDTIFCTNTSAIIPSKIADVLKNPERFMSVHFHTYVWEMSFVGIMPYPGTDPEISAFVKRFVIKI